VGFVLDFVRYLLPLPREKSLPLPGALLQGLHLAGIYFFSSSPLRMVLWVKADLNQGEIKFVLLNDFFAPRMGVKTIFQFRFLFVGRKAVYKVIWTAQTI